MNVPPAIGIELAALQSPPQYKKGEVEEKVAGEWGREREREEDRERGSERGKGGVPGPFLEPFFFCFCRSRACEGETARERGKG